ncbi:unnamed protein product [Caenorhabditis brenneri]
MFSYRTVTVLVVLTLGVVIVAAFPIEIKNIEYLFPPQNTIQAVDGSPFGYETKIDRQVGDSEEEDKIRKACIQKQNADASESQQPEGPTVVDDGSSSFDDTTPINGTVVDDPMEVKIYRPECDD